MFVLGIEFALSKSDELAPSEIQSDIEALDKNIWKWCAVLFKAGHELTCKARQR